MKYYKPGQVNSQKQSFHSGGLAISSDGTKVIAGVGNLGNIVRNYDVYYDTTSKLLDLLING
jgi:hypothetical protein